MRILIAAVISSACLLSCQDLGSEQSALAYEDNIREAVFRYQFLHNYSGNQQNVDFYFLSIPANMRNYPYQNPQDHDPADRFLSRFGSHIPRVRRFSDAIISGQGVFDSRTGLQGLLFRAGEIEPVNNSFVKVYGGYYEGGGSFSLDLYFLSKRGEQWIVAKDSLLGIG